MATIERRLERIEAATMPERIGTFTGIVKVLADLDAGRMTQGQFDALTFDAVLMASLAELERGDDGHQG